MDFVSARANMLESQVRTNDVTDIEIQDAMRAAPRERLVPPSKAFAAYAEVEVETAPGRWLMKPRDIGKLLQAARPRSGETALALAAPYAAMVLARMGLTVTAQDADARADATVRLALEGEGVACRVADFDKIEGRYDVIVCEHAVTEAPTAWLDALADGGRLAVVQRDGPVGKARLFVRTAQGVSSREVFDSTPPMLAGFEKAPTFEF